MPPQPDQAAATLLAYQQATARLRDQLAAFLTALWRSLGTYRNEQMGQFTGQAVPVVAGAQQQMAALTAAYLAQQQSALVGTPFLPVAVDTAKVTGAAVRNGTNPVDVYERPFHLVWRQLAELPHEPGSIDAAIQAGLDRTVQTGMTDLQLAKTHTSQRVLAHDKHVVGYRRVLEGAYSCALCIVASTQRYHKRDLMPIHPACDCEPQPIYGDSDVGQVDDAARLDAAHAQIAAEFGRSDAGARDIPGASGTRYADVLITHDHGELGPVLSVRHRPFRGPKDIGDDPRLAAAQAENQRRGESLLATLTDAVKANRTQ